MIGFGLAIWLFGSAQEFAENELENPIRLLIGSDDYTVCHSGNPGAGTHARILLYTDNGEQKIYT